MEEFVVDIKGYTAKLPILTLPSGVKIAFFNLHGNPAMTEHCGKEIAKLAKGCDVLITAESKGIPLAYEMARQEGVNRYLIARKAPKLYMKNVFTVHVNSITTDHQQTLCIDGEDAAYMKGKRVLIVDDVISTGESLKAVETLVEEAGGNIVGRMAILAEGDAQERRDITYLEKLPLFHPDGTVLE